MGMAEAQNPSGEQKEEKMTEEQVQSMVARVEGKCENIRDDIADMAMSEQYLRTKQALLKAKKKEQDADCSENGFNTRGGGYQDEGEGCENAGTSTIKEAGTEDQ